MLKSSIIKRDAEFKTTKGIKTFWGRVNNGPQVQQQTEMKGVGENSEKRESLLPLHNRTAKALEIKTGGICSRKRKYEWNGGCGLCSFFDPKKIIFCASPPLRTSQYAFVH